jgi:EAL domain-containing protein (putative c-di-GMP-specific phosphodiesterase class I)
MVLEEGTEAIDEAIRAADIAMLRAKESPDGFVLYTPQMREEYLRNLRLHSELRTALREEEFLLYYQPLIEAGSGKLLSAEVLLRWRHPEEGLLTPDRFLPVARQFNLIPEIDFWVLERVCRKIREWRESGGMPVPSLSVNLDARLLFREEFIARLGSDLERYGIRKGELILEITEDSLVENFEEASRVLEALRKRGVECAIDDFGTGYSSLSYLKKLSFDILKIDREFVRDMLDRIENLFLLRAIIRMGEQLGYRIVVEGVENERQRRIVADIDPRIGCQGYLFDRPLDEENFLRRYPPEEEKKP